jgi:hypothetical protein
MAVIVSGEEYTQDPLPGMSRREITELGVLQIQNGISSIDEVRERLDLPPWGTAETSEPVMFTSHGPVPMAEAAKEARRQFAERVRVNLLEKLVRLLTEEKARSEEITRLRRDLDL